jgi:homoserine dehydrogenase
MAAALENGKHLVTANKEVIAKHGADLLRLAAKRGVNLFYEASVGGGIPIVHVLRHELVANEMMAIKAIINGTTNFILSEMSAGRDYAAALAQAQKLGYAEADPRNDVEGIDATYKLAILSTLAFHSEVRPSDLRQVGITKLDPKDFRYAAEMGYVVKLIAWAKWRDGMIEGSVYPMLLPERHHLAAVKGSFNAIVLDGDQIDQMMLYGRGAGSEPTASAVVADICRVALDVVRGVTDRVNIEERSRPIRPFAELPARFYFRIDVADQPGVLAQVTQVLGTHQISIASVIQKETDPEKHAAELVIMTHSATEGQVEHALAEIRKLDVVYAIPAFIRVER